MPPIKPPSEDYIFDLKDELLNDPQLKEDNTQVERTRAVRELKQPSGITDDWRITDLEVRDTALSAEAFDTAAMIGLHMPTFEIKGSSSTKGQENADERERWTEELFYRAGRNRYGMHAFMAIADAVVGDGAGWSQFVLDEHVWDVRDSVRLKDYADDQGWDVDPDKRTSGARSRERNFKDAVEEAKRQAGPPFKWRQMDVLSCYPNFAGGDMTDFLRVTKRPVSRLFRDYRLARGNDGGILLPEDVKNGVPVTATKHPEKEITFLEHWDETHVTYAVEGSTFTGDRSGRILFSKAHKYGRIPIFPAYGLMMNQWANRKVGWGTVELLRTLVELRSFLFSLVGNVAARDTFTLLQRISDDPAFAQSGNDKRPGQKNQLINSVKWKLREIVQNPPGTRLERVDMGDVAASLKFFIDVVETAISQLRRAQAPSDLGSLEASGFAINRVLMNEAVRFGPVVQNIEAAMEDQARFAWSLVRNVLKERVWIYVDRDKTNGWLSMGPEDLADTVNVRARLKLEQAEAELIKSRYYHERLEKGTIGWETAVEKLGDSPIEVLKQQARKRVYDSDWYQAELERLVAVEAGRGDLIAQAQAAKQMAISGALPQLPPPGGGSMGQGGLPGDAEALSLAPGGGDPSATPPVGPGPTAGEPMVPTQSVAAGMGGV